MNIDPSSLRSPFAVVDVAAWVGCYPFRGIPKSDLPSLQARAAQRNIQKLVVSSFENLFWENNLDAYEQWQEKLAGQGLWEHWPVVNPSFPRQLERLAALLEKHRPHGLRLLPNYHGYSLMDACVAETMALARERGMIVQIFERIADERWHWMLKVPPLPTPQLDYLVSRFGGDERQRLILSGVNVLADWAGRLAESPGLYVDLSRFTGPVLSLEALVAKMPLEKLLFGSLWPIQILEAPLWEITSAHLADETKQAILGGNASRLLKRN